MNKHPTPNWAAVTLVGVMLALATLPALAGAERMDRAGPFAFRSDDEGQWASPYTVDIRTDGVLRIAYRAPRAHCSALRVHVSVDESVAAVSAPVGPGQRSEVMDLGRRAPGMHFVSIQPEGVPGGCNTGNLKSWGGTFQIWTSGPDAGPHAPRFADPGEIFLEVERINTGDGVGRTGVHIGVDGAVRLYGTTRSQYFSPPAVSDDDVYGLDWLYGKYGTVPRIDGHVDAAQLVHMLELARSVAAQPAPKAMPSDRRRYLTTFNQIHSTYSVYLRDPALGGYRRIEFAGRGVIWTDARPAGAELTAWLDRLAPAAK